MESHFGLYLPVSAPGLGEWALVTAIGLAGTLVGMIPAWRAYRYSLADGLIVRT